MRILLTGASGMLGITLQGVLRRQEHDVIATDLRPGEEGTLPLDVRDRAMVGKIVKQFRPDVVVHLAAETDVDLCERDPEHAHRTNTEGTANVAAVCRQLDCILVYLSTGAVFDGEKPTPYTESDSPRPVNIYGESKLQGEQEVRSQLNRYFIIRAGWMVGGGPRDKKFVGKILSLIRTRDMIEIVGDKFGTVTYAEDLSVGLVKLLATGRYGLYHMANEGVCSRFDVANRLVELTGRHVTIRSVSSDRFPLPAPRPRMEGLDCVQLREIGLGPLRPWGDALKDYVASLDGACQ